MSTAPILEVRQLAKHYPLRRGLLSYRAGGSVRALDGVRFILRRGETLGLVGESGCGKSTLARTLLRLEQPSSGTALYRGQDIYALSGADLQRLRRGMQIVFQDPYAALNPRMTVAEIITEAWQIHPHVAATAERPQRLRELLVRVGLSPEHAGRYPHQFSGGQRQRIGIARALALNPEIVICDEAVSALDVSVQAQVINLLRQLRDQLGLAYLFIAHDLAVVRHLADRVAVMYLGKVVEHGPTETVFTRPAHPYTQALLSASPLPDPEAQRKRTRIRLQGDPPDPSSQPSGCGFRGRCWRAQPRCAEREPALQPLNSDPQRHSAACFFPAADADGAA